MINERKKTYIMAKNEKRKGGAGVGALMLLAAALIVIAAVVIVFFVRDSRSENTGEDANKPSGGISASGDPGESSEPSAENPPEESNSGSLPEGSPASADTTNEDKTGPSQTGTGENNGDNISGDEVEQIISQMSLHEKVCQLFIVTPESLTNNAVAVATASGDMTRSCLEQYPVGGLIYFAQNLESMSQAQTMLSDARNIRQELGMIPMFYAVDEEGGTVARCAKTIGTTAFQSMYDYKDMGTDTAYSNAFTIASDIANVGFNLDFAPVADTWSNSANTVIGRRAYSDDFSQTAELVASAVQGFNDGGVYCTLKHFPGHGDTAEDSHYGTATIYKSITELEQNEYLAFQRGIEAGADMVMMGHMTMANVDGLPASVSKTMITDELRGKLGYDGVVVTDALGMGAVANMYGSADLAVRVLQAGGDILLMPADFYSAVQGVENAVANGTLTEERIDESVRRILKLKAEKIGLE